MKNNIINLTDNEMTEAENIIMKNKEIYVSCDIEADGPIPGPHSMLSFGSAAFIVEHDKPKLLDTFYVNLKLLKDAAPDPNTQKFWDRNQEAYAKTRIEPQYPTDAMNKYHSWLTNLGGTPVFVGYPATFDFMFVYWYLVKFAGSSPFSFSGLDIKTYAMAMMKTPYRQSTKKHMPKRWFDKDTKHTHHALDDATEQGKLFMNMMMENNNRS